MRTAAIAAFVLLCTLLHPVHGRHLNNTCEPATALLLPCGVTDSLPPTPLLLAAIDSFHARQARIRLLELQDSRRGNWLRYLPAIGIAYTPTGAPRPAVSYSSALIYTAQKDRQQRQARQLAVVQQAALDAEADKRKLMQLLGQLEALQRELAAQRRVHEIDTELFRFYEKQAATQELLPAELLLKKREYLLKCLELEQQEARLRALLDGARGVAHYLYRTPIPCSNFSKAFRSISSFSK
jgi:hypothetical protein